MRQNDWQRIASKLAAGALIAGCFLPASGCVRRRMTVRTNPSGAMVYVDRQPVGTTPVSVPYVYYGTRNIEVTRDGYRTEKILRTIYPPWYQVPPLDFASEVLWPWEIRDERVIDVELVPEPIVSSQEFLGRAEELRLQAGQGLAVSLPPSALTMPPAAIVPQGTGSIPTNPNTFPPQLSSPVPVFPQTPAILPNNGMGSGTSGLPAWQPGGAIGGFLQPGGQPPLSIPNVGIPGAGFRPEVIDSPAPSNGPTQ